MRAGKLSAAALEEDSSSVNVAIARAATLTSLGNLSSRLIGLVRETVKSFYFGNGQAASAFELAANVPTQFYDLLAGGMLSSALVPTFSALHDDRDPQRLRAFGELLGALISLMMAALAGVVALLWLFARPIAVFISGGSNQDVEMVAGLLRVTIPAIIFLNLSGILTGALHAQRRFGYTAFTATTYNLVMIAVVVLMESRLGVTALAVGLLMGSAAQVLIQVPGLRGVPLRLSLNWRLPGVVQVVRLFLPVAGGLALSQIAVQVSFISASRISPEGPATMRYAAQVIQFPLGMIVTAVAAAILPALSSSEGEAFKATLKQGLRLVVALIAPASVGLYVLAVPMVALLFERGAFTAQSTAYTASTLRAAVPGLFFAALDLPLIYAFYARRDTRTPTMVGLVSTVTYLLTIGVLTALSELGVRTFTLEDLVLTNSLKTGLDAALMAMLLHRHLGSLFSGDLLGWGLRVAGASLVMGLTVHATMMTLMARFSLGALLNDAVVVFGCACAGAAVYAGLVRVLGISDLGQARRLFVRRSL